MIVSLICITLLRNITGASFSVNYEAAALDVSSGDENEAEKLTTRSRHQKTFCHTVSGYSYQAHRLPGQDWIRTKKYQNGRFSNYSTRERFRGMVSRHGFARRPG